MKKYRFHIKDEFGVIINSFYINSKVQRKHIAKMLDSLMLDSLNSFMLNSLNSFMLNSLMVKKATYNLLDLMYHFIVLEYIKYEHINEDIYKEGKMLLKMSPSNFKKINQFFQFASLSEAKIYFSIKQIIE